MTKSYNKCETSTRQNQLRKFYVVILSALLSVVQQDFSFGIAQNQPNVLSTSGHFRPNLNDSQSCTIQQSNESTSSTLNKSCSSSAFGRRRETGHGAALTVCVCR